MQAHRAGPLVLAAGLALLLFTLGVAVVGAAPTLAPEGDSRPPSNLDLAVGVPYADLQDGPNAGAALVLYSAGPGLSGGGSQYWSQASTNVGGAPENGDNFAVALAAGDFDGDGYADLAIGVPFEDVGDVTNAGIVHVLYGGYGVGLVSRAPTYFVQGAGGLLDAAEQNDLFGAVLAAGDLNGDYYDDLAVGVRFEAVGTVNQAGAVHILYGSAAGLTAAGNQLWHQDSSGIVDDAEENDQFGAALAIGDFNRDIIDDLAIGVPNENLAAGADAGVVHVLYGAESGLAAAGSDFWHQDSPDVEGVAGPYDYFGTALATGDMNGDQRDDLAIGVPGETVAVAGEGAVNVLYGAIGGLTTTGNQLWTQADVGATPEADDAAGSALAIGDFDNNGYSDLAAGVPNKDIPYLGGNIGVVTVLQGSAAGLTADGAQVVWQWGLLSSDMPEPGDQFGAVLAAGDLDLDRYDDLAVGVPNESVGDAGSAGAVNVLHGCSAGLFYGRDETWTLDSIGVPGALAAGDQFGYSLAIGDFDHTFRILLPIVLGD